MTVTPAGGAAQTLTVTQQGGALTSNPTTATVPATGGAGDLAVMTDAPALQWTAVKSADWITITSGSSGAGAGTVHRTAANNSSPSGRSATITVTPLNGTQQVLTITQQGATGTGISLNPTASTTPAPGGINSVQIPATSSSITWTAASNQAWLTLTSAASGTGTGSGNYAVTGNPSATPRTATITVTPSTGTPQALIVTQAGGVLSISPTTLSIPATGSSGQVLPVQEETSCR